MRRLVYSERWSYLRPSVFTGVYLRVVLEYSLSPHLDHHQPSLLDAEVVFKTAYYMHAIHIYLSIYIYTSIYIHIYIYPFPPKLTAQRGCRCHCGCWELQARTKLDKQCDGQCVGMTLHIGWSCSHLGKVSGIQLGKNSQDKEVLRRGRKAERDRVSGATSVLPVVMFRERR